MKTMVLDRQSLKNNISVIREKAGPAAIFAVLTGDGFGTGAVELARILREEGIGRLLSPRSVRPQRCARRDLPTRKFSCSALRPIGRNLKN